jgi:hypothetical protein
MRACDLVAGGRYYSPLGKLCMLLAPAANGLSRSAYLFAYLTKTGKPGDEGFAINADNTRAIAAMRDAGVNPPMTITVYIKSRGIAA